MKQATKDRLFVPLAILSAPFVILYFIAYFFGGMIARMFGPVSGDMFEWAFDFKGLGREPFRKALADARTHASQERYRKLMAKPVTVGSSLRWKWQRKNHD